MPLSFPDTPDILTSDEAGLQTPQTTPFTFTFTEDLQQILFATNIAVTDATVGDRQFMYELFSDTGLLYWQAFAFSVQAPSSTEQHYWPQGAEGIIIGLELRPIDTPAQLYAKRGWTWVFRDFNAVSAGDIQFIRFELDVLVRSSNAFA
jgi:hypothetical protein